MFEAILVQYSRNLASVCNITDNRCSAVLWLIKSELQASKVL